MKETHRYPNKEVREISHMQNFVSLFEDYNIEKWEKKDPPFPDFLIYKGTNTICVEHTSLICDKLMKIRNAQKSVLN